MKNHTNLYYKLKHIRLQYFLFLRNSCQTLLFISFTLVYNKNWSAKTMMEYFCFMNEKVLKTLEYNKILNQLSEYACSPEAKKTLSCTASHHRQSPDWAASAPDEGCIKPSVPLWKPLIFRRAQCQWLAETFRDRCLLKCRRTAFDLFSLRGCQACKSIFPLRKRGSPGRFTDRIFHRNRTADTALWRD